MGVEIKYVESTTLPEYLKHLNELAIGWAADSYRDVNRIVGIKVTAYDSSAFPALVNVDQVYLVYRGGKTSADKRSL